MATPRRSGGMADAGDSKSPARKGVPVRVRPPAPRAARERRGALPAERSEGVKAKKEDANPSPPRRGGSVLEPVFLDLVVDRFEGELQQLGGLLLVAARE